MAEFWSAVAEWVMPVMIALVIYGQRRQGQDAARILTQQAVHETCLKHVERRLERLESQGEGR